MSGPGRWRRWLGGAVSGAGGVVVGGARLEVVDLAGRAPALVLLHEGLGSAGLWRSFPGRLAAATGRRVVAYSRAGYGASDPASLPRPVDYLHREALEVLPPVLDALGIHAPVLVGHSDGASIAVVHAGGSGRRVSGLVLLAPHTFVEERTLEAIAGARCAYLEGDLRGRLGRHHGDVDVAFWGWNDVWLSADFRSWDLGPYLPAIEAPALVVQGDADPYGSLEQVERLRRELGGPVQAAILAGCGHAPHVERPEATEEAVVGWLSSLG